MKFFQDIFKDKVLEKILDIIEGISYEKGLPIESVMEVVKESVIKVAQQTLDSKILYDVEINKKKKPTYDFLYH